MDNIITFVPKKVEEQLSLEERISKCFHASISFDSEHEKSCIYCIVNKATSEMIFDILAKDMTQTAKNKKIVLCTFDLKQVLHNVLQRINEVEYKISTEQTTEEARTNRKGPVRLAESRQSEAEERDSELETGITTITPPDFEE